MNLRRLWAVARKEALHIRRDPRSLILAIGIPMLMIVTFGYALTLDVDRVPLAVWDQSATPASREFISRFASSRYFSLVVNLHNYAEAERAIDTRRVILALVIPPDFAQRIGTKRDTRVEAIIDGSDANTGAIVLGYATAITSAYNQNIIAQRLQRLTGTTMPAAIDVRPRVWFNADLESKNFIIPGLIAVIMGLIAALLTSLTIAREWERGTMEQLISTPVKPTELIFGKLIPYFIVGMVDVLIAVGMAVFIFHVPFRGSLLLLLGMAAIFIVCTLAQGILISTLAKQQLLASQMAMVSTFLPAFLLSGFMFAISNMPLPVQIITRIIPARYFVALVKGIYLRGVGLEVMWREAVTMSVFAVVVLGLAIVKFRKKLG